MVDAAVDGTLDYLYPLVDYGQFQVVGGVYVVDVIDRYPAVKVKTILTAIFKDAGYSIEGTYIDGAEFEALFMLFGKNVYLNTQETIDSFAANVGLLGDDINSQAIAGGATVALLLFGGTISQTVPFASTLVEPFYDNGSHFQFIGNGYVVLATIPDPVSLSFNVNLHMILDNTEIIKTTPTCTVQLDLIGSLSGTIASTGVINHTFISSPIDYILNSKVITFSTNEVITVKLTIIQVALTNAGLGTEHVNCVINKDLTYFEIVPDRRRGINHDYTSAEMLPDITRIDFIKGVAQMLNLYFLTNENTKTVIIEKSTDFHGATGQDFSSYASKEYQMKPNKIYEYLYAMKDDTNDANLVDYKNVSDEYKSYRFEPENQNEAAVKTIRNGVFAATILRDPYRIITVGKFPYPVMWKDIKLTDEYEPDYNFDLRIMKYEETIDEALITWDGSTGACLVPKLTMDFLDYQKDYLLTNLELNEQFDLTVKMYLPIIVINNILTLVDDKDLRAPIYLDYVKFAGWYDIESISNYNLQTGECTLKLIKARKNATL